SLTIYEQQQRPDLAAKEAEEIAIIERYLPKQLSPDELQTEIKAIIAQLGATSAKDMGKVMGVANKQLAGIADGKQIAALVKTLLT
nr:GatB/YqeY domain-containing protein [Chitinophagales bacterium]